MPKRETVPWNMARRRSAEAHAVVPVRRPPLKELRKELGEELKEKVSWVKEDFRFLSDAISELDRLEKIYAIFWKELNRRYGDALEMYAENAIVEEVRPIYLKKKEGIIRAMRTIGVPSVDLLRKEFIIQYARPVTGARTNDINGFKYLLRKQCESDDEYQAAIGRIISAFRKRTAQVIEASRKFPPPLNDELEEAYIKAMNRIIKELRET